MSDSNLTVILSSYAGWFTISCIAAFRDYHKDYVRFPEVAQRPPSMDGVGLSKSAAYWGALCRRVFWFTQLGASFSLHWLAAALFAHQFGYGQ